MLSGRPSQGTPIPYLCCLYSDGHIGQSAANAAGVIQVGRAAKTVVAPSVCWFLAGGGMSRVCTVDTPVHLSNRARPIERV
eukprot:scaffold626_cov409-Prasinococcus_capsulatus_cf.AAC.16